MNINYIDIGNLKVSENLVKFVNEELLVETNINPERFWSGFDRSVHELAPKNKELLEKRKDLQKKIDDWHIKNKGNKIEINEYKNFLKK